MLRKSQAQTPLRASMAKQPFHPFEEVSFSGVTSKRSKESFVEMGLEEFKGMGNSSAGIQTTSSKKSRKRSSNAKQGSGTSRKSTGR